MAGNPSIPNLIAKLKLRMAEHDSAMEAEGRFPFDELAAELRRITALRKQTPSELLLREGRDEH